MNRTKESDPGGWLEVDDRGADVFAGQGQGLLGLRLDLRIRGVVVQCLGEVRGEPDLCQGRRQERCGPTEVELAVPHEPICGGEVEDTCAKRLVEQTHGLAAVLSVEFCQGVVKSERVRKDTVDCSYGRQPPGMG